MRDTYLDLMLSVASPKADTANINSIIHALEAFGGDVGLDQPHRIVQFIPQIAHESGGFRYDKELWGPTPAQKGYDTRFKDLGNSPELDGDGEKYKGRTGMQITGRRNYQKFYEWCIRKGYNAPNFVDKPDLVNQDPWEGLVPLWYWDEGNPTGKSLNIYADQGDNEMVTRRINGGLNGFADRLDKYTTVGLKLIGYSDDKAGIAAFQQAAKAKGLYSRTIDGLDGPGTRAAIHQWLVREGTLPLSETKASPVTELEPVAPQGADRVAMTRWAGGTGVVSMLVGFFGDMPDWAKLGLAAFAVIAVIVIVLKAELIASRVKSAIKAFGLGN